MVSFSSREMLPSKPLRGGDFPLDPPTSTAMIPPLFAPESGKIISMQGSLGNTIWTFCYFVVLLGLSLYGLHRYVIVYLYLKNRHSSPKPLREFEQLPRVTVQFPMFNELYVVERLLASVAVLDSLREVL